MNDSMSFICRYVGSNLKNYGLELGRITGLDPAEPHFELTHPRVRLDETDAFYVDVIHTDANPLMSFGLGMWQKCGHLDFYPNGGRIMAGCKKGVMSHVMEVWFLPMFCRELFGGTIHGFE
jgi:hypothetical protein